MLKQYKEAIEKSNIISRTDTEGFITFVNEEFCKISGYTKDELIGQNHNIVRHPSVSPQIFKNLWDTIKNKKIYSNSKSKSSNLLLNSSKTISSYFSSVVGFPFSSLATKHAANLR